jgi:hypothetical protein
MVSLVKLRMAKLSSHFSGHRRRFPSCSYSTRILRENIWKDSKPGFENADAAGN